MIAPTQPKAPAKPPSKARQWSRLEALKKRKDEFNKQIDAEIEQLKATLGEFLAE